MCVCVCIKMCMRVRVLACLGVNVSVYTLGVKINKVAYSISTPSNLMGKLHQQRFRQQNALTECLNGVPQRSASTECLNGVAQQNALTECINGVPQQNALTECLNSVPQQNASTECFNVNEEIVPLISWETIYGMRLLFSSSLFSVSQYLFKNVGCESAHVFYWTIHLV